MHTARSALLALMMVLMLPLGALNAWVPVATDDTGPAVHLSYNAGAQTQGPRSCRSAILPGAGCAKFIDLAAAQKLTQTRAETLALPRSRWQPAQDGRAPPKAPPRTA